MAKKGVKLKSEAIELDMTPMIDMSFQLIAFFMILINFSESEQYQKVQLPSSVLAKPAEKPFDFPVTIHLTKDGIAVLGGQEVAINSLGPFLAREAEAAEAAFQGKKTVKEAATIIVRAHKDCATGNVQKLIEICQKNRFEKFVLRAQEEGD
jgi:biopolymer transport protein ExbD